jgi:hypothetical protein
MLMCQSLSERSGVGVKKEKARASVCVASLPIRSLYTNSGRPSLQQVGRVRNSLPFRLLQRFLFSFVNLFLDEYY